MVLCRVINYTHSSAEFGSVASQQKVAGLIATCLVFSFFLNTSSWGKLKIQNWQS